MNPKHNGLRPVIEKLPGRSPRSELIERRVTAFVCVAILLACVLWTLFR